MSHWARVRHDGPRSDRDPIRVHPQWLGKCNPQLQGHPGRGEEMTPRASGCYASFKAAEGLPEGVSTRLLNQDQFPR